MAVRYITAPAKTVDIGGTALAYRELGSPTGVPAVLLNHLGAVLDNWDPRVVDGLAAYRHVIAFDNRGIDGSGGRTRIRWRGCRILHIVRLASRHICGLRAGSNSQAVSPVSRATSARVRPATCMAPRTG